ncbi:hypothetical protein CHUAL_010585 [Chamberlinius hualienensis]
MDYRFQTLDYIVVFVLIFSSAAYGLYAANVKHSQSTLIEYFLAGKNISIILIILSYFSSFAAGGMTGQALEVYIFGSQNVVSMLMLPVVLLIIHHLIIPVFYPLQNMSMLQHFKKRFGNEVAIIAMVASIGVMLLLGSANIFISAIVINQVSALSFWVAATLTTGLCILYSTLGGMRGIVITDALQAILMIVAIFLLLIIGTVKSGGLAAVWDINNQYDRLQLFNFNLDPTVRYTFWSAFFGFGFMDISFSAINQTTIQRCIMAPNLKSAQNVAKIGIIMGLTYLFLHQILGLVTFAYYAGCNIQQTGKIKSINQLNSYFAMEMLYEFPTLPGFYFSGLLSATLRNSYFPLNKVSFMYISLEVFLVTVICFILLSAISVKWKCSTVTTESNWDEFDINMIPPCIQKFHKRLSKNCRKWLLCDVYDNNATQMQLTSEQQSMMRDNKVVSESTNSVDHQLN